MQEGYEQEVERLKACIAASKRIAFLGGAGVSTESGIPDFRSEGGVYAALSRYGVPPEELLSHEFFMGHTEIFYDYYKTMMLYPDAKPNAAHRALARLEEQGKLTAIITQNIDGLHQKAGSKHVLELHGSVLRNYCMGCRKFYSLEEIEAAQGVPLCGCGGTIKPDVVLYGEGLDPDVLQESTRHIRAADMLIVGGTSLSVYPAAGLTDYFRGEHLVLINKSATPQDRLASLVIHAPIGAVLSAAV